MNTTAPKPFVFVLMPFEDAFKDVYEIGIKEACNNAGAYAERVDEQLFTESMLDRIKNQISKADVIVADMTGKNPNAFYETGYAPALNKKVILLTQKADDIPFDTQHYKHIVYEKGIGYLREELEKTVRWAIQEPKNQLYQHRIQFYHCGKLLSDTMELRFPMTPDTYGWNLKLDAHNPVDVVAKEVKCKFGIIIDSTSTTAYFEANTVDFYTQPDSNNLCIFRKKMVMTPGSWESFELSFHHLQRYSALAVGDSAIVTIRTFAQDGISDITFRIIGVEPEQE